MKRIVENIKTRFYHDIINKKGENMKDYTLMLILIDDLIEEVTNLEEDLIIN